MKNYLFTIITLLVLSYINSYGSEDNIIPESAQKFPICGILTDDGLFPLSLLIPHSNCDNDNYTVLRYEVISYDSTALPPFESYKNWWICITDGKIIDTPDSETSASYGKIIINSYKCDKSNAEMGME